MPRQALEPGAELGRGSRGGAGRGAGTTCASPDMRLSPRHLPSWGPESPPRPSPTRARLAHHEMGLGLGREALPPWVGDACLHPRGQGMPKVVKGPELGLMGTGWSAMPASPSSRLISPEELGFIRREKNPKGTGRAGCCSCRDFRLQEGLQDSEEMTRFPLPGFGEWGESRPAWHGKCPA